MKTITAGDKVKIKVQAKDDQSGIEKVEVEVTNLRDLPGAPTFEATGLMDWPTDADEVEVEVSIPEFTPASKWKVSSITLINGAGRPIKYSPSKDFKPILFKVKAKEGIDLSPAELIDVTLVD